MNSSLPLLVLSLKLRCELVDQYVRSFEAGRRVNAGHGLIVDALSPCLDWVLRFLCAEDVRKHCLQFGLSLGGARPLSFSEDPSQKSSLVVPALVVARAKASHFANHRGTTVALDVKEFLNVRHPLFNFRFDQRVFTLLRNV